MKRVVATFSGAAYNSTTALTVERAPQMGADEVLVFDDDWLIRSGFVAANAWLYEPKVVSIEGNPQCKGDPLDIPQYPPDRRFGFGWCAWKSAVISHAFDRMEPGDVCLYLDADTYPIAPFGQLFDYCAQAGGIFLFQEYASTLRFTKADCFRAMGLPIQEIPHACGRFSLWQKGPFLARQVLSEWWAYSVNPRCMFWDRSILGPDQPEYQRNSTEQSVLTNLAWKHGIPLHRTPDQFGSPVYPDSPDADLYPQVFEQKYCEGDRTDLSGSRFRSV